MKNSFPFIFFLSLLVFACKKPVVDTPLTCVEQFIADHQLVPYTGQDLGCKLYTRLFELDGQQYFQLGSACADMFAMPVDCAGNPYCSSIDSPELIYFSQHAVVLNIIGFQE